MPSTPNILSSISRPVPHNQPHSAKTSFNTYNFSGRTPAEAEAVQRAWRRPSAPRPLASPCVPHHGMAFMTTTMCLEACLTTHCARPGRGRGVARDAGRAGTRARGWAACRWTTHTGRDEAGLCVCVGTAANTIGRLLNGEEHAKCVREQAMDAYPGPRAGGGEREGAEEAPCL